MATRHFCDICDQQVPDPKEFHVLSLRKPEDNHRQYYHPQHKHITLNLGSLQICYKCFISIEKHVFSLYEMARTIATDK